MNISFRRAILDEVLALAHSSAFLRGSSRLSQGTVSHDDGSATPWRVSPPEDFIRDLANFDVAGTPVGDFQDILWNPLQEAWVSIGPLDGMRQVEEIVLSCEGRAYFFIDSSTDVRRVSDSLKLVDEFLGDDGILCLTRRLLKGLFGSLIYSRALTGDRSVGWCEATVSVLGEGLLPYGYDTNSGAIICYNPIQSGGST
jgi:hypothetical protein